MRPPRMIQCSATRLGTDLLSIKRWRNYTPCRLRKTGALPFITKLNEYFPPGSKEGFRKGREKTTQFGRDSVRGSKLARTKEEAVSIAPCSSPFRTGEITRTKAPSVRFLRIASQMRQNLAVYSLAMIRP